MFIKSFSLTNERQQFSQQAAVFWLENIDVAGTNPFKIGDSYLALIGAAFAKEHLARLETICEGDTVFYHSPPTDTQILWFDVFEADITLDALGSRIGAAVGIELNYIAKSDPIPPWPELSLHHHHCSKVGNVSRRSFIQERSIT